MDQNTRDEYKADANAIWAWLKAHPRTVSGVVWFVVGFVLGKLL